MQPYWNIAFIRTNQINWLVQELEKPAEITERENFDRRSIKQIKQTIKLINWFIPQLKTKSLNKKIFTVDKSLWKSNKSYGY